MASVKRAEQIYQRGNVRGLCRMLKDRDVLVRRRAAQLLGQLANPSGVSCLREVLHRASDEYVIRWSLEALGQIATPAAIDALTDAVFSSSQRITRLAQQTLAGISDSQAQIALQLYDVLFRNDWDALASMGEDVRRPLMITLQSEQFHKWPSGKRKQVLTIATRLGVKSTGHSREMLNMGLFVGGVHTVGDLLRGLRHQTPDVRIAAAEKLALSNQRWTTNMIYRRFRKEVGSKGERSATIAMARALTHLGDNRAIAYYKRRLYQVDSNQAAEAARTLAEIGAPAAVRTLFWFAANPPPPPAYRNVPMTLSALERVGPSAVDVLRPLFDHEDANVRRLLIEIITRTTHTHAAELLAMLAADEDENIQHAALDALAGLNTSEAAQTLAGLSGAVPERWVTRALASITHPDGPRTLRTLVPDLTSIYGILLDAERQPLHGTYVQMVKEHHFGGETGWDWQAVSARATTDDQGRFALTLLTTDEEARLQIKVTLPGRHLSDPGETFTMEFTPDFERMNSIQVRIDRFFNRLVITHIAEGSF